jgi:hypothetical protein
VPAGYIALIFCALAILAVFGIRRDLANDRASASCSIASGKHASIFIWRMKPSRGGNLKRLVSNAGGVVNEAGFFAIPKIAETERRFWSQKPVRSPAWRAA